MMSVWASFLWDFWTIHLKDVAVIILFVNTWYFCEHGFTRQGSFFWLLVVKPEFRINQLLSIYMFVGVMKGGIWQTMPNESPPSKNILNFSKLGKTVTLDKKDNNAPALRELCPFHYFSYSQVSTELSLDQCFLLQSITCLFRFPQHFFKVLIK